jgi:hypothetical protein
MSRGIGRRNGQGTAQRPGAVIGVLDREQRIAATRVRVPKILITPFPEILISCR